MIEQLIILGLACGTASTTLAQSRLFEPARKWLKDKWAWGGELISCPYCLGHWLAAGFATFGLPAHHGWLTVWLAITAISALTSGLIGRLYE